MAMLNGRKGGERVVESRHLIGLFLGVVLLCGVFFTLGYVMGRPQVSNGSTGFANANGKEKLSGPKPTPTSAKKDAPPANDAPEWDFYPSKNPEDKMGQPAAVPAKASASAPAATAAVNTSATLAKPATHYKAPLIPRGAFVLQVAALRSEGDALALTGALQQKRFPAFVATPAGDNLFRIQVGPYADQQSATQAKKSLEREGFRAIVKR